MTAPGFTSRMRFTVVTGGSVFHRSADARRRRRDLRDGVARARRRQRDLEIGEERQRIRHGVAGDHHRHHVGERRSRVSALGERRAVRRACSRPPPRTLTKSASIASWSCVKKLASMLPRMIAR